MYARTDSRRHGARGLLLVAVTMAPLTFGPAPILAAAPVRVVGCDLASLSPDLVAAGVNVVGPNADGESSDQDEEDQQPKIVGSIPKPHGVSEDDSKKLEALNLATITRDQAIQATMSALVDPAQRAVRRAALEGENGYLVWSVKTVLNDPTSGPDPKLEAKVDAGGEGRVLSVECDPNDD